MDKILARPIPELSESIITRFWSKVDISYDKAICWNWKGNKMRRGYGGFSIDIKNVVRATFIATRISYFIKNGECPIDKAVCHSCDNPSCVNPGHLFLGTNKDNTDDMMAKKRGTEQFERGSGHRLAKINENDVISIRELSSKGVTQLEIGKKYNLDQSTVSNIITKKRWAYI